MDKYI
jgi:hypothetical protein